MAITRTQQAKQMLQEGGMTFGVLSDKPEISKEINQKVIEYENEFMERTGKVPPESYGEKYRIKLMEEFMDRQQKNKGGRIDYKEGSKKPVTQAGVKNFLGKQKMVTAPKFWLSEPGHVKAKLAYITDEEEKILIDKNLYGSLKGFLTVLNAFLTMLPNP